VDALSRLIALQGTAIPKFYGSGNAHHPANARTIQPRAVLIKYIHGTPLADLEVGKLNILPVIFPPLLEAVIKFKDLGLFHSDINEHNDLVDFGCAGMQQDGESDED